MKNILVLCSGNSCRSQMAHGYLDKLQNGLAKIYSAGIETHGLNPSTEAVIAEEKHTAFIKARNEIKEYCQKFVLRE